MPAAARTMPSFTGYVLDERFEVLHMIGTGSYGVVYKAMDLHPTAPIDGLDCAIKIVRKAGRTFYELNAVRKEVELQSLVSAHPNVVAIHDAFEDEHFFYLVLDLCHGGDLFEQICLKRAYANNDDLLRSAFLALVDAVETCHQAKIFHRDLKPENILTSEDGSEVFLADFGLATDRTIVNEFCCGTSIYMSPECIGRMTGGKPYCTRFSDIWALGVILVNMISGRHPWSSASATDCCFSQYLEDPTFLRKMLPISEGANAILQRIFTFNPLARITLEELRDAVLALDTFFMSADELAGASDYAKMVADELGRPIIAHRRFPGADPTVKPPREERDIAENAGADPTTPIARRRSFMVSEVDVLPRRKSSVRDGQNCSAGYAVDWDCTSSASSSSSNESSISQLESLAKVVREKDIGESEVWARNARQDVLAPIPIRS